MIRNRKRLKLKKYCSRPKQCQLENIQQTINAHQCPSCRVKCYLLQQSNGGRVTKMNTFMTVLQVQNAAAVILLTISARKFVWDYNWWSKKSCLCGWRKKRSIVCSQLRNKLPCFVHLFHLSHFLQFCFSPQITEEYKGIQRQCGH